MQCRRSFFFCGKNNNPSSSRNLRPVGVIIGFYCLPAQRVPASAIAWRSSPTAGSEMCGKWYTKDTLFHCQDCHSSFKSRVGNSLFGFLCVSLVICVQKSKIAIHSLKKREGAKSDGSDSLLGIQMGNAVKNCKKNMANITNFGGQITCFLRAKVRFALKKWVNHSCHSFLKSDSLFKESNFERKSEERKCEFPTLLQSDLRLGFRSEPRGGEKSVAWRKAFVKCNNIILTRPKLWT